MATCPAGVTVPGAGRVVRYEAVMILSSMRRTVFASGAALAVLTLPLAGPAAAASVPTSGTAGETVSLPVSQALAALPVRAEDRTGYERSKFRHWIDADGDGCSTRQEVLKRDALTAPVQGPRCALTGGTWLSPYDDMYIDDASKLDIDHLVSAPTAS